MAIKKAKVGDYVKVIKKLPYKDKMDVKVGDIGVVNYVASTGKYSVHIKGKNNPHDTSDQTQYGRLYGEFGDFWIPFECCEVVDNEELIRQCLFENADALDTPFVPLKSGHILTPEKLERYDQALKEYLNKESEENKMKEIKNQKVVDLYFERKKNILEEEHRATQEAIIEADKNYIFVQQLKDQFNAYVEENEIKNINKDIAEDALPLTEETNNKYDEIYNDYLNKVRELKNLKEEITALLSGCDTYEQEMEILQTYKIVNYNTHYVSMNKIDASETN